MEQIVCKELINVKALLEKLKEEYAAYVNDFNNNIKNVVDKNVYILGLSEGSNMLLYRIIRDLSTALGEDAMIFFNEHKLDISKLQHEIYSRIK